MQTNLADSLQLIAEHAPKLRAAGVHSLAIDGITLVLLPPDPPAPVEQPDNDDAIPTSDLDDPTTYGRLPGSSAPGFMRPDDL